MYNTTHTENVLYIVCVHSVVQQMSSAVYNMYNYNYIHIYHISIGIVLCILIGLSVLYTQCVHLPEFFRGGGKLIYGVLHHLGSFMLQMIALNSYL